VERILLGNPDVCYYCGHQFSRNEKKRKKVNGHLPSGSLTVDHVIPLSRYQECGVISIKIVCVYSCLGCNTSKGNLLLPEFIDRLNDKPRCGKRFGKIGYDMIPTVMRNTSELLSWIYTTNFA
jgi:hypothetical protein